MLTGFRTYLVAALMAAVPALTTVLGGVDWSAILRNAGVPDALVLPLAGAIAAAIMAFMRSITTTPPATKP